MIHSSSVAGHHFLTARRRGYDPAEVDAVIKRLVATLRKYEERDAAQAAAADTATVTHLEQIRRARRDVDDATDATEELRQQVAAQLNEARLVSAEALAAAQEKADEIVETARADAAALASRRSERSEALITSALSEVKTLRSRTLRETNEYRAAKQAEAASLIQSAELTAEELVETARHEAGSMLGRARREHAALEKRLAQLRSAISDIEGRFRNLTASTLEQTEIMSSMISLETDDLDEILEEKTPDVVRLTQQSRTIDLTERPAASSSDERHLEDRFAVAPGNTIYQRRGGGLRQRLEAEDLVGESPEPASDTGE